RQSRLPSATARLLRSNTHSSDRRRPRTRMDTPKIFRGLHPSERRAQLEQALVAWHSATIRLQQTHAGLRAEVSRMADDLEMKTRELEMKNGLAELGQVAASVARAMRDDLAAAQQYTGQLKRRLASDLPAVELSARLEGALSAVDSAVSDLL